MTSGPPAPLDYFRAPAARRARFVAWVCCAGSLFGGTLLWLYLLRGEAILDSDAILIGGWAALGFVSLLIAILLRTTPPDAILLSTRFSHALILGGAAALQAAAVTLLVPALSEDVLRYRIDGRMWLSGVSPYSVVPYRYFASEFAGSARLDAIDVMAPFMDLNTIYPPTAQLVFAAARSVEDKLPKTWPFDFYTPWRAVVAGVPRLQQALVLRVIFAAAAVACTAVLLAILAGQGRSPWYAVLLAWNPLFVLEPGGMGHVDVVGVLFVLLAMRALQSSRPLFAAAMLALAAGVKSPVVLLAPFLFREIRQPVRLAVAFVVFLAIVYSPMLIDRGYAGWLRTSQIYGAVWEANGSIYDLIKASTGQTEGVAVQQAKDLARVLAAAMVALTMLFAWGRRADFATAGYWIFLVALLFGPVVYPWYLLWASCFVPLLRAWGGMTALVWSATIGVSYLLWRTSDWVLPARWLLVEYLPVYAALGFELWTAITQPSDSAARLSSLHR